MEQDLTVCLGCRHPFTVDYRNRGRVEHPQEYCHKPACRAESSRVSRERYRTKHPEDMDQVCARVKRWRKECQQDSEGAESNEGADTGRAGEDVRENPSTSGPGAAESATCLREIDALTGRLTEISGQMAALIVTGSCSGSLKS